MTLSIDSTLTPLKGRKAPNPRKGIETQKSQGINPGSCFAYGWPADLSDEEILARLLELNLERAEQQAT